MHVQVPRRGRRAGPPLTRVGILGGTFNPPQLGHMLCAQEALVSLELDRVLFLPVHAPPHKEMEADPGLEHRVALCRLAVADDERLDVCLIEAGRPGPSYTVDTLRELTATSDSDLTFIVGGDQAYGLPGWREPEAVLELASLAIAEREGVRRADILERLSGLRGVPERLRFFDMPRIDVSSTMVRRRVAAGRPVRWFVPDAVGAYIADHALYRAEVPA